MKPQPAPGKLARLAGPLTLALGYVAAVVLPVLGALLSLNTHPFQTTPLALSFAAIAIVTLLSGPGPGIVASISTGASYVYQTSPHSPPFSHDPREIVHTAIIVLLGIVVTYFCERQTVISGRLEAALGTLQLKTDALIEAQQASSSVVWTYNPQSAPDPVGRGWRPYLRPPLRRPVYGRSADPSCDRGGPACARRGLSARIRRSNSGPDSVPQPPAEWRGSMVREPGKTLIATEESLAWCDDRHHRAQER